MPGSLTFCTVAVGEGLHPLAPVNPVSCAAFVCHLFAAVVIPSPRTQRACRRWHCQLVQGSGSRAAQVGLAERPGRRSKTHVTGRSLLCCTPTWPLPLPPPACPTTAHRLQAACASSSGSSRGKPLDGGLL